MPNGEVQAVNKLAQIGEINRPALMHTLEQQGATFLHSITEQHAHLFANTSVFVLKEHLAQMQAVIAAVETVVSLPKWAEALAIVKVSNAGALGVFYGYDFHLNEQGAQLIEINTNAGGAFLNAVLLQSQAGQALSGKFSSLPELEQQFVAMFQHEWQLERSDSPLQTIAIVDEQPQQQYLYPEFILARQMFERAGISAYIVDPEELQNREGGLYVNDIKIDLVYNRLTDFSLQAHSALFNAYRDKKIVVTPHPAAYSRYADKLNLTRLTDEAFLQALGADEETIRVLHQGIPQTRIVSRADAEQWWASRKQWFFKPMTGYGAKGAYRGDKMTKRVFDEILAGDYVAQKLAPPGECLTQVGGENIALKYDVRCYVYNGEIQLIAARLYQGQTTNFRTPGGGFGIVLIE